MDNPAEASGDTPATQKLAALEVRRILAPTDMSEFSGKAIVYAVRLGLALQAQVIALYVSEVFVNLTGSPVDLGTISAGEVDGWRQEIKRRFDAYLDRLARIPDTVVRLVRASMDPWKGSVATSEVFRFQKRF
jgi:nucleotide-binding universal stress UspA family protein